MKRAIAILVLLLGCTNDRDKVKRVLERDGYTNVSVGGWTMLGCGREDTFSNTFTAEKNGQKVNGWVCGGLFKGLTVRTDD